MQPCCRSQICAHLGTVSTLLRVGLALAQPWVQEVSLPQQAGVTSGRQVARTEHDVCPQVHLRPQPVAFPGSRDRRPVSSFCQLSADAAISLCTAMVHTSLQIAESPAAALEMPPHSLGLQASWAAL